MSHDMGIERIGADPKKAAEERALLPGLKEALLWKPNTPQLENAMTYAWEQALRSFIRAIEANTLPSSIADTKAEVLARKLIEWAKTPHPLEETDDELAKQLRVIRDNTVLVCRALLARSATGSIFDSCAGCEPWNLICPKCGEGKGSGKCGWERNCPVGKNPPYPTDRTVR